jgi:ribosomal protein S18 acetylase RimI-like enzyme
MIREATESDLMGLLRLYTQLHGNAMPEDSAALHALWRRIIDDPGHHIIVADEHGEFTSSCVLIVVPNLTHGQRPYALVENVITHPDFRRRGLATACLDYARGIAVRENCYKVMLMTGSKEEGTLHFYEQAGYNRADKTAFIQWL